MYDYILFHCLYNGCLFYYSNTNKLLDTVFFFYHNLTNVLTIALANMLEVGQDFK